MKTNYDTKVEYIEDNQNVSLPCIQLVMTLNVECFSSLVCVLVAMATVLSTIFLFDLYTLIISIVAWNTM